MPIRSEWKLAREGVTQDTIGRLLSLTLLNPALTLPLLLLARYTQQGKDLSSGHASLLKHVKTAVYLGIASKVSGWLDQKVSNNFSNDTYDWNKEVVIVTGGSDGIGKVVVHLLAERGIKVAVMDVQDLTYEAPPTVTFFKTDLASPSSIKVSASAIKAQLGHPTVLINNAGIARGKSILGSTEVDLRLTFNVNTLSHYFMAQEFLPHMIETNHGLVLTVASFAGYITAPYMVDYCSSKAAAIAFHEGLSAELATVYKAPKVRTVLMCQNYTRTKLFEGFDSSALYPETVAEEIVKAVLKGKSNHLLLPETGWLIVPRMRSFPFWMQYGIRKRLVNLMAKWQGRQVVQPSVEEGVKEKMEESAVLVEGK
ncbi:NAD(P)-binding protein [Amniculicola lignicola CBS 123094]|uniref:Short-chain dehydrogenase/reductase 3 n=1 Tax=Amniculicola lignicola CBS 123094 TaxID=1392246 RepID=A0A6A5X4W5_9PLEO|nr:NAD(P)-binding protein [Amniculicola lignicola CBS 123094]